MVTMLPSCDFHRITMGYHYGYRRSQRGHRGLLGECFPTSSPSSAEEQIVHKGMLPSGKLT